MTDYAINQPPRGNVTAGRERILNLPRAFVYRVAAGFSIPNGGVATAVSWDTMVWDVEGMWSAANPTRLTCVTSGTYTVQGWIMWPSNSTSFRQLWIVKTTPAGFALIGTEVDPPNASTVVSQSISRPVLLNAGDYVELAAGQNTSGALTLAIGNANSAFDHGFQACLSSL